MPRGKLILICQVGGDIVTKEDGTQSYTGGEAHAIDITPETLFDDLKLKLAEMCNLELESLSMKYFLPGNRRTLITLANDKDLKRMYEFHGDSITVDVFVAGKQGFIHRAPANKESGLKPAETVTTNAKPKVTAGRRIKVTAGRRTKIAAGRHTKVAGTRQTKVAAARQKKNVAARHTKVAAVRQTKASAPHQIKDAAPRDIVLGLSSVPIDEFPAIVQSPRRAASKRSRTSTTIIDADDATDSPTDDTAVSEDANDEVEIDMNASPADAVKKRRRTATWRFGANGPTIVSDVDSVRETRKGSSRKSSTRGRGSGRKARNLKRPRDETYDVINFEDGSLENMVAMWKDGIIDVGQDFKNVAEFRDVLQKYAIAHRFGYKLKKNDTNRASGICVVEGCPWRIHASWVASEEVFRIKKLNNVHTCGEESWKSATPTKSWLVKIIKARLKESPHHKTKDIAKSISHDFGMKLHYSQVYRAIEDAREQLQGSYKESYDQLPWFCDKVVEANPGSYAKLFVADDHKFQRLFVSFHASIYGFLNGCRPLIFLDSTSFKSKYHEMLLTATALDADDGFFPVAFAVVDVENEDNWHWFLEELKLAISSSVSITFVFDREKGLMKHILELFETAYPGYSIYHLLESFKKNWKFGDGKSSLTGTLVAAAHAVRVDAYTMFTEQIKLVSTKAYDWLMQVEPEYWTSAAFKGEPYNQVTVNVAEFYSNWIEEVWEVPILQKVETLRCKIMELINQRQVNSEVWDTVLTPSKEQKLYEETLRANAMRVLFSSETLFEVHDSSTNIVDITKKQCSCQKWKLTGLPCGHAVAVFNRSKKSVYDYCPQTFTVESYRRTYSKSISPILAIFTPSEGKSLPSDEHDVLPPTTPRPPAQPKEKPDRPENAVKRVVTCARCKGTGHNKATCKADV